MQRNPEFSLFLHSAIAIVGFLALLSFLSPLFSRASESQGLQPPDQTTPAATQLVKA